MKTDLLSKPNQGAPEPLGRVFVNKRGRAEQELASLLRYGHFHLTVLSTKLGIPVRQLLEMRSGAFFNVETQWIFRTAERIRSLVRSKQI